MAEIYHGRGYVYSIQYHIVWCVKYRHKILTSKIEKSLIEILNKIAATKRKRVAAISVHKASNDNIYQPVLPDMINCFRSELEAINGKCIVCSNNKLLIQQLKNLISEKQLSNKMV